MVRNPRNEIQKNYIASQSFAFKKYQWKTTRKSLIMELCTKSIFKNRKNWKSSEKKNSVHWTLERATCTGGWYVTSSVSGSLRLMLRPLRPVVRRKRRKTFLRGRGASGRSGASVWNLPGFKWACQVVYRTYMYMYKRLGETSTKTLRHWCNNNTLNVHANRTSIFLT